MTFEIGLTLAIIVIAVVLFATEKLRVDVIALMVLLTLVLTGLLSTEDAFSGFSNTAVITVWAVYIVSGALAKTGVTDVLGERIARLAGKSEPRLIAVIMLFSGLISAFMNNIGAVAMLLPAVVGISRKSGVPLSRLMIPLAFASLMGGNMTQIGTPPNILASSILLERGLPTLSFFDFTPMGVVVFTAGILYMVFIGRHLLPVYKNVDERQIEMLKEYTMEVRILPGSSLANRSVALLGMTERYDINILAVIRHNQQIMQVSGDTLLFEDDILLVSGDVQTLIDTVDKLGLAIEAEREFDFSKFGTESIQVMEATLMPGSSMMGKTLRELDFREKFGLTVLAIWQNGKVLVRRLGDVTLRVGDALLIKGPRQHILEMRQGNPFMVLETVEVGESRPDKALISVGIMVLVLFMATFGGLHISTAMVIGALLTVLTGCQSMEEAYKNIEWRSVFLIAGMLPLGLVMEQTGTAQYLANLMVGFAGGYGVLAVLAGIYILSGLITEPMSNAAATVLMAPLAIDIALNLQVDPRVFVLAVVIGASTSFLTPVGHQVNVLVMGPGGYRFSDYTRVGWLLNIVIFIVTMVFLPIFWPLH